MACNGVYNERPKVLEGIPEGFHPFGFFAVLRLFSHLYLSKKIPGDRMSAREANINHLGDVAC